MILVGFGRSTSTKCDTVARRRLKVSDFVGLGRTMSTKCDTVAQLNITVAVSGRVEEAEVSIITAF